MGEKSSFLEKNGEMKLESKISQNHSVKTQEMKNEMMKFLGVDGLETK